MRQVTVSSKVRERPEKGGKQKKKKRERVRLSTETLPAITSTSSNEGTAQMPNANVLFRI